MKIIFDFYFQRTYKMSHWTDSDIEFNDLLLEYYKDDELTATVFGHQQNITNRIISSFIIGKGGIYSIKFKLTEWYKCRGTWAHVKCGIIGEKDIHQTVNREQTVFPNYPKDMLYMICEPRRYMINLIEMIIEFQNTSVIQFALYIQ
eukprot:404487_1